MRGRRGNDIVATASAIAAKAASSSSSSTAANIKALKKKSLDLISANTATEGTASTEGISSLKNLFQKNHLVPSPYSEKKCWKVSGGKEGKKNWNSSIPTLSSTRNDGKSSAKQKDEESASHITKGINLIMEGCLSVEFQSKNKNLELQSDNSIIATMQKENFHCQHFESASAVTKEINSILQDIKKSSKTPFQSSNNDSKVDDILSMSWFSSTYPTISQQRRERLKERKAKWATTNRQTHHFNHLVRTCVEKLGTQSTFEVLSKLGRETGIKECKSLINLYTKDARNAKNAEDALIQIHRIIMLFKFMLEQGFELQEETYGAVLLYLIDKNLKQEFLLMCDIISNENPKSKARVAYYTMLFCIRTGDEATILDMRNQIEEHDGAYSMVENFLLAFCECDRKDEILYFLEVLDIRRISSFDYLTNIFKSLGRLLLEDIAENFIAILKTAEAAEENISVIIYEYVSSMPTLAAEELLLKFSLLHKKHDLHPCAKAYDKLFSFCCNLSEVDAVVNVIDQMCQSGLTPSTENFRSVFGAIEHSGDFDLVRPIHTLIVKHKLVPSDDTVKSMVDAFSRMGDFVGAYNLISYLDKMDKKPTTGMYNAILAGHFRENDTHGAFHILNKMTEAGLERDAETYSYLLTNCKCEEEIVKLHDEMKKSGVASTKPFLLALINAYANCGMFDKAKQVALDVEFPFKHLNDTKSVLISALASNGRLSNALEVYDDMKQAGCSVQNKAILCLIEYTTRSEKQLERLLQLLHELNDSRFWIDASGKIVLYCLRYNLLNSAVELLKQMKVKDEVGTQNILDQAFSQLWEAETSDLKIGLKLLRAVKEELQFHPSRISLDFLLSACVKAKDSLSASFIWREYDMSNLPLNALTFLRLYQVLLAAGELKAAEAVLKKIPKGDPHIRVVINACQATYILPIEEQKRKAGSVGA